VAAFAGELVVAGVLAAGDAAFAGLAAAAGDVAVAGDVDGDALLAPGMAAPSTCTRSRTA